MAPDTSSDQHADTVRDEPVYWFSNGTEFGAWQEAWCSNCAHDHDMHGPDASGGCALVLLAMDRQPIPEWDDCSSSEGFTMPPAIYCARFTPCIPCGDPEWAQRVRAHQDPVRCPVEDCRFNVRRGEDTCYVHRTVTPAEVEAERRAKQVVREMLIVGLAQSGDEGIRDGAADAIAQLELELQIDGSVSPDG